MGLTGELPEESWQFTELQILDLSYNIGLNGSLHPNIQNLRKLKNLILVGCSFTGPIPDTIGNLDRLVFLSLNSNIFSGSIPASIGNLRNLYWLDLSSNNLTGSVPASIGRTPGLDMLTHAKHFHLADNQLSGDIPSGLFNSNMTLIHLLLDNNSLTGTIPSTLGLVTSLEVVRLDRNSLSGNVPTSINNLFNTTELFLSNNQLTGPIPNLTGMTALTYLDLSNNTFDRSTTPSWFSTLLFLTTIVMQNTNLGEDLPTTLFRIPQLQNVDLSYNSINGTLDISSNPSTQLLVVDLTNNLIEDFIQKSQYEDRIDVILVNNPICGKSSNVTYRFCSPRTEVAAYSTPWNNCEPPSCDSGLVSSPNCRCAYPYMGSIFFKTPSLSLLLNPKNYTSLSDSFMTFFEVANFPVDSVSLNIPGITLDGILEIKLEFFPSGELSFSRRVIIRLGVVFGGQIFNFPEGFDTYYFIGETYDNFLPEISTNSSTKHNSSEANASTKHKSSDARIIMVPVVVGCVLVVLLVLAGMYSCRPKERSERATQEIQPFAFWDSIVGNGGVPELNGVRSFTFEELQTYTDNFSEINNIGKGGYGMVYRGTLPNGQLIAIKRAQIGSSQGAHEFKTEIELLSRVHHKNVVVLIGFCCNHNEQMLVYEYVVNGTLKDSLSGRSGIRLDWMHRLTIALGAARGLQYLHDHADPPIIHRDVKTDNILLDERLVAKVADFGISKPLSDVDGTHVTTQVKGTVGYMDPEYYMTQQLTEKSDIYSFGVVMLELITARNPIDKGKFIVWEVKEVMNKNIEMYALQEILDPIISLSGQLKGFESFVDLAFRCVEDTRNKRPTTSEIVKEIECIMELMGLNPGTELSVST